MVTFTKNTLLNHYTINPSSVHGDGNDRTVRQTVLLIKTVINFRNEKKIAIGVYSLVSKPNSLSISLLI